jgi:hypothetical protein
VWLSLALAVCVNAPSLWIGLVLDDHGHRIFLQTHLAQRDLGSLAAFDLFDVCGRSGPADIAARIHSGALPWWAAPNLSIAFFRPFAVFTHYLDYVLWPSSPALMHAFNIALYLAIVLVVARLYRRLLGVTPLAALALLLYAIDDAHADGTAWIAGRNTLLCALFVLLTLLCHDYARRDGSVRARWLAVPCLLSACASGEGAIAVWAYLVPYAWLVDRGSARERIGALAPLAVVTIGWQWMYRALGYGVRGGGFYRDPVSDPLGFITQRLPESLPGFLREQLGMPGLALGLIDALRSPPALALGALIAAASLLAFLRLLRGRRDLLFWTCALLGSLLPPSAAGVTARLLFIPGVAAFVLVAELVLALWTWGKAALQPALRGSALSLAGVLLALHVPVALAFGPLAIWQLWRVEGIVRLSADMLPSGPGSLGKRVFVLDTPTYFGSLLAPLYRAASDPPIEMHVLCAAGSHVRLTRRSEDTIVLEVDHGFLREATSWLVRAPELRFHEGQLIATGRYVARIEKITSDGRPLRVSFQFASLADPHNVFIRWRAPRYEALPLPPVGHVLWVSR